MSLLNDASLILVPSAIKTGEVLVQKPLPNKFADETGNYDGNDPQGSANLTFTRASNASRVNADGLVERVRTNLNLYSNDFSNAAWVKGGTTSVTPNAGTDPNGGNNAWQVVMSAGGNLYQNSTPNWNGTQSIYAKVASGSASIKMWNGVIGTSFTLTTSWQRLSVLNVNSSQYVNLYNDSGSSVTFLVAFGQAETGDIATEYIPTTTAAVSVGPVSGLPRLDYSGGCPALKLEPQRTNYATNSEAFSNWSVSAGTITSNATTSPDGYVNADLFTEDTTTGYHRFVNSCTGATGSSKTYSVYAKWAGGTGRKWLTIDNGPIGWFDIENGVTGNAAGSVQTSIQSVGNGWYRCIYYNPASSVGTFFIGSANVNGGAGNHLGNGQPAFYVYGAQCEDNASYATSYIPTLGSAVTRLADSAYKTGISSLIGQTEGTVFLEMTPIDLSNSYTERVIKIYGGGQEIGFQRYGNDRLVCYGYLGGPSNEWTFDIADVFTSTTQSVKIAMAYKANDVAFYVNGVQKGIDSSASMFSTLSILAYADNGSGSLICPQNIKQNLLFKTRLTNAQLAELTTL